MVGQLHAWRCRCGRACKCHGARGSAAAEHGAAVVRLQVPVHAARVLAECGAGVVGVSAGRAGRGARGGRGDVRCGSAGEELDGGAEHAQGMAVDAAPAAAAARGEAQAHSYAAPEEGARADAAAAGRHTPRGEAVEQPAADVDQLPAAERVLAPRAAAGAGYGVDGGVSVGGQGRAGIGVVPARGGLPERPLGYAAVSGVSAS